MSKCSICGGDVTSLHHCVYHTDGSSSGEYWCQKCGAKKGWKTDPLPDSIIDMGDKK